MNYFSLIVSVLILFSASKNEVKAQSWVAFSVSQNTYIGDLNPASGSFYSPSTYKGQLGYSLSYERVFDESISWFVDVTIGEYEGAYSLRSTVDRNKFSTDLEVRKNEFILGDFKSLTAGFNWKMYQFEWVEFYSGLGIGVLDFSVKDLDGRLLRDVSATRAEGETYPRIIMSLPLKMGIRFFQNSTVSVSYEIAWVFTNSDYLDNIGEFGEPGSDAIFRNLIQVRYRLFD